MILLQKGRYRARLGRTAADVAAAQRLRRQVFRAAGPDGDSDTFDALSQHVLVEDRDTGALQGCFRFLLFPQAGAIGTSYSAQSYDLSALTAFPGTLIEIGRFCLSADDPNPDVLRLAWAALTRIVDGQDVKLMFGCTSFQGADPARHGPALALLRGHLAPDRWAPRRKATAILDFPPRPETAAARAAALAGLPGLLRTYLDMGGWVSDHAVIDRALDTLHVFTAVEIARIPPVRARLLRALAETGADD